MNEITILFKKHIITHNRQFKILYSQQNKDIQQKVIDEFEESRKKNNYTVSDIRLIDFSLNTIPLYALLNHFTHPIFIQYFIDTYHTSEFIKENTAKIQDSLKWLYISVYYDMTPGIIYRVFNKEEQLYIIDEYARILNITYDKYTYERTK